MIAGIRDDDDLALTEPWAWLAEGSSRRDSRAT
jgi:hypothetical protein